MVFIRSLVVLLVLAATSAWGQTPQRSERSGAMSAVTQDHRFALAIGINDYRDLGRLTKAVNDARAVGQALERAGFRVTVLTNASRADMNRAINQFVLNLSGGGQGVFFFAGHGVQINNQNYLLPADIHSPQVEADVADQAVSLQGIQDKLAEVRAKFALLVVDACRDNPLPRRAGRSLGATRGLAQASSAEGQMVVFSAGANQQALDRLSDRDTDPNGVFTREFLPWISTPGVSVRDAVLQVRSAVRARARTVNHEQFPAVYDQVDGNFFFVAGSPSTSPAPMPDPEVEAWEQAKRRDTVPAYEAYLRAYPQGRYAAAARTAVEGRTPAPQPAPMSTAPFTPGSRIQDCPECPEMVVIPAGSFMMGSPESEAWRGKDEGPQQTVVIAQPLAMGRTEVTIEQWGACVAEGGCSRRPSPDPAWDRDSLPMINASWDDAQSYVSWLSRKTGQRYRLPTEAEWEYACRARERTLYCGADNPDAVAWTGRNSGRRVQAVATRQANAWGLHDMSGNVWEWTEDCYVDTYVGAPADGSARISAGCTQRVLRGGSWRSDPAFARSAERTWAHPAFGFISYGFRVVRARGAH